MTKKKKTFTLDERVIKKIMEVAESRDRSQSYVVNECLEENLKGGKK